MHKTIGGKDQDRAENCVVLKSSLDVLNIEHQNLEDIIEETQANRIKDVDRRAKEPRKTGKEEGSSLQQVDLIEAQRKRTGSKQ